ncbi:putative metalloprotease CJM1_0395 family protein [Indioceanicola profundi]|uniref:putative metalloprotease CJM1_0395 family protein n=1 Tax=Indioceanicola profundi TaxID=2220096 RepID=UPI000E6AC005|nr:putative metalloprotease CJM1_0395 family protein [Indioceanicola profundi]
MVAGISGASGFAAYPSQFRQGGKAGEGPDGLTEDERKQVDELRRRDAEVRAHERTHQSVGGQHAGAPTYDYQKGPDGRRYAIGGEVKIDASPEKDPEKTIANMEVVRRAALAPAEPSPQDRKVAAQATRQAMEAQGRLSELREAEREAQQAGREAARERMKAQSTDQGEVSDGEPDQRAQEAARRATQAYERIAALDPSAPATAFQAVA